MTMGKLTGIKVVDLSMFLPGPVPDLQPAMTKRD